MRIDTPVGAVTARAYTVPTDAPEAGGTFAWTDTTVVLASVEGGGRTGLGLDFKQQDAERFAA